MAGNIYTRGNYKLRSAPIKVLDALESLGYTVVSSGGSDGRFIWTLVRGTPINLNSLTSQLNSNAVPASTSTTNAATATTTTTTTATVTATAGNNGATVTAVTHNAKNKIGSHMTSNNGNNINLMEMTSPPSRTSSISSRGHSSNNRHHTTQQQSSSRGDHSSHHHHHHHTHVDHLNDDNARIDPMSPLDPLTHSYSPESLCNA